jgi:hypothetical protein
VPWLCGPLAALAFSLMLSRFLGCRFRCLEMALAHQLHSCSEPLGVDIDIEVIHWATDSSRANFAMMLVVCRVGHGTSM